MGYVRKFNSAFMQDVGMAFGSLHLDRMLFWQGHAPQHPCTLFVKMFLTLYQPMTANAVMTFVKSP